MTNSSCVSACVAAFGPERTLTGMSFVAFCAVGALTLLLCVLTGPDGDRLDEFYNGYGSLSPFRGGLAIAGEYISSASVLGAGGLIAVTGYDGVALSVAIVLSLVLMMFLLAEPLRNTGRFTMGDVFARRLPNRSVRIAAFAVTVISLLPLMLIQLASVGELMAMVLGFSSQALKTGCVVGLGLIMMVYAAVGGMRGTALIQILKSVLLIGSGTVIAVLTLHRFDWDLGILLNTAAQHSGEGAAFLHSGLQFSDGRVPRLDMISSELTVVLGVAVLPQITMRVNGTSSTRELRRSLSWAITVVAAFVLILVIVEFGAVAMLGRGTVLAADQQGNAGYLMGARASLGTGVSTAESLLFTLVTTTLFLTLMASVAGLFLACANSLAHDVFATRKRAIPASRETLLGRLSVVIIGVPTVALATVVQHRSLIPLVALSFCLGASVIAPALVYSLFWRRYTTTGLMATLVGGSLTVLLIMPGTRLLSGTQLSVFPGANFNWFPFTTPGIVSVPAGFLLGWIGTLLTDPAQVARERRQYEAVEGEILAGAKDKQELVRVPS